MNFQEIENDIGNQKHQQLGDRVYKALLDYIINGNISTGESLSINLLAKKLKVSNTPIRESLNKLCNNGIVKKIPYKGYKVVEFSSAQIRDIYETRIALETYACKLAAKRVNREGEKELKSINKKGDNILKKLKKKESKEALKDYKIYNKELHNEIIRLSKNEYIENFYNNLYHLVSVMASQTIDIPGKPFEANKDHKKIIKNIIIGEGKQAASIMEKHVLESLEHYIENVKK